MQTRRAVVIHYTEGGTADSSLEWWEAKEQRAIDLGAHFIIDRDGHVIQCRSINKTISHAGVSRWRDPNDNNKLYKNCNGFTIGIELANAGTEVTRIKGVFNIPGYAGSATLKHRNENTSKAWERFSVAQTKSCLDLCHLLKIEYNLDDITGHDCIAPERKIDPGPAFDDFMRTIRCACGFGLTLPTVHYADGSQTKVA